MDPIPAPIIPQSKPSRNLIFLIILIILNLSCLTITIYLYRQNQTLKNLIVLTQKKHTSQISPQLQNTPTPLPDQWKHYSNDQYQYSFNYPADDKLTVDEKNAQVNIQSTTEAGWYHSITFTYIAAKGSVDLQKIINNKYNIVNGYIEPENIAYDIFSDIRFKIASFSAIPAVKFEGIRFIALVEPNQGASEGLSLNQAYLKHPTNRGYILMENIVPTNSESTPLFDQILSTFEFVEYK